MSRHHRRPLRENRCCFARCSPFYFAETSPWRICGTVSQRQFSLPTSWYFFFSLRQIPSQQRAQTGLVHKWLQFRASIVRWLTGGFGKLPLETIMSLSTLEYCGKDKSMWTIFQNHLLKAQASWTESGCQISGSTVYDAWLERFSRWPWLKAYYRGLERLMTWIALLVCHATTQHRKPRVNYQLRTVSREWSAYACAWLMASLSCYWFMGQDSAHVVLLRRLFRSRCQVLFVVFLQRTVTVHKIKPAIASRLEPAIEIKLLVIYDHLCFIPKCSRWIGFNQSITGFELKTTGRAFSRTAEHCWIFPVHSWLVCEKPFR